MTAPILNQAGINATAVSCHPGGVAARHEKDVHTVLATAWGGTGYKSTSFDGLRS